MTQSLPLTPMKKITPVLKELVDTMCDVNMLHLANQRYDQKNTIFYHRLDKSNYQYQDFIQSLNININYEKKEEFIFTCETKVPKDSHEWIGRGLKRITKMKTSELYEKRFDTLEGLSSFVKTITQEINEKGISKLTQVYSYLIKNHSFEEALKEKETEKEEVLKKVEELLPTAVPDEVLKAQNKVKAVMLEVDRLRKELLKTVDNEQKIIDSYRKSESKRANDLKRLYNNLHNNSRKEVITHLESSSNTETRHVAYSLKRGY